jgi:hypothetical protein
VNDDSRIRMHLSNPFLGRRSASPTDAFAWR